MLWWSASGGILTPIREKGVLIYSTVDYNMVHALAGIFIKLLLNCEREGKELALKERKGEGREWGVAG